MKKQMKIAILTFGIIMLATENSNAAKVCVANDMVYKLYHNYKSWYCHTSTSDPPSVGDIAYHGPGKACWCLNNGSWYYFGDNSSRFNCTSACEGWCELGG
jgi:hypothetical protein